MTKEGYLERNAFFQLGVSPRDRRERIVEAAEELVDRGADETQIHEAQQVLLAPRRRLAAEIRWFPDVKPQTVRRIIEEIGRSAPQEFESLVGEVSSLARVNLAVAALESKNLRDLSLRWVTPLIGSLEPARITADLNLDRSVSGFQQVTEEAVVQELQELEHELVSAVICSLEASGNADGVLTALSKAAVEKGGRQREFVEKICQRFEERSQKRLIELESSIDQCLASIVSRPADEGALSRLLEDLSHWDAIMQPHQILHEARALDEPRSKSMVGKVRAAALTLANEKGEHQVALKLTAALREHFPELPGAVARLESDAEALVEIIEEKKLERILEPLIREADRAKAAPKEFTASILRSDFLTAGVKGGANDFVREFSKAANALRGTDRADLPWVVARDLALRLHNEDDEYWGAHALIVTVLKVSGPGPSPEVRTTLERDRVAAQRSMHFASLKSAVSEKKWDEAIKQAQALVALASDASERAEHQQLLEGLQRRKRTDFSGGKGCGILIVAVAVIAAIGHFANEGSNKSGKTAKRPPRAASTAAPAPPQKPSLPLPATGQRSGWYFDEIQAPFRVDARGVTTATYLKLVDVSGARPDAIYFLRAGEVLDAQVPPGSYRLRMASGRSWYGEEELFGPKTSYSEAATVLRFRLIGDQLEGHGIQLEEQIGGNLAKRRLSPEEF
ncbi:MAG: hypothetical protein AMXMBFR36_15050 [Acidobacteriota bacterium]